MSQDCSLEDRFFELSIDLLCQLDFNGYFRRLNLAWERTLGFTIAELTSRPFIEFVHPDDRQRTLAQNARVRAGGQALEFGERLVHPAGVEVGLTGLVEDQDREGDDPHPVPQLIDRVRGRQPPEERSA